MSTISLSLTEEENAPRINPNLYGHFAEHLGGCIYGGIWVGEDSPIPNENGLRSDVIAALRDLNPPVLRWPGGCFADDYHWEDGIGPREERPRRINLWWGENIETNHFGTHEFVELCRRIGARPYFAGNLGSAAPNELRRWVEYCNFGGDSTLARQRRANGAEEPFGIEYWGIGNENWGCGGNMEPDVYAAEYRRYSTFVRELSGTTPFLIACGPNDNNLDWTHRFLEGLGNYQRIDGYAAHYYTRGRRVESGTATEYSDAEWYGLIWVGTQIEQLILDQREALDSIDPERKIGLIIDEWGTWHPPTPGHHPRHLWQQNTMRDALVAATTLDIFNRHADKIIMANIAQTINVLQAMILTDEDRMLLTPSYHVFQMYRAHQGGERMKLEIESEAIRFQNKGEKELQAVTGSASRQGNTITVTLVNASVDESQEVRLAHSSAIREVSMRSLSAATIQGHNTFERTDAVKPTEHRASVASEGVRIELPPASVSTLTLEIE